MKTSPDNQPPDEAARGKAGSPAFEDPEELIAFARKYFSTDFPNLSHLGCPPPGTLSGLLGSGKLPQAELRAHLLGCSECFCEYREAMASHRSAAAMSANSWWPRMAAWTRKPGLVFASAITLLTLLFVGVFVWRELTQPPAPSLAKNGSGPSAGSAEAPQASQMPGAASEVTPTPEASAAQRPFIQRSQKADRRPHELIAKVVPIEIDLEDYTTLRDVREAGSGGEKPIKLPPSRTRLVLRLPERGAKGLYHVSIVDAYGKPLITEKRKSPDGKTLTIILNLSGLSEKASRLSVARAGQAPDFYPVVIGNSKATLKR